MKALYTQGMEQINLSLWLVMVGGVLLLLQQVAVRVAAYLQREARLGESRELSRIAAFGLIAYSVSQDLTDPDRWLWIYWLLICFWFYINSRIGKA